MASSLSGTPVNLLSPHGQSCTRQLPHLYVAGAAAAAAAAAICTAQYTAQGPRAAMSTVRMRMASEERSSAAVPCAECPTARLRQRRWPCASGVHARVAPPCVLSCALCLRTRLLTLTALRTAGERGDARRGERGGR